MIENSFDQARKVPQEQLRAMKEKDQEKEVQTYVSTNNPKILIPTLSVHNLNFECKL